MLKSTRRWRSGQQLSYQVDIAAHGLIGRHAAQRGPCLVLGGTDEIEEAGAVLAGITLRALLVQRIELEQGVVVGPLAETLDVDGRLLEFALEIVRGQRGNQQMGQAGEAMRASGRGSGLR